MYGSVTYLLSGGRNRVVVFLTVAGLLFLNPGIGAAGEPNSVEPISVDAFDRKIQQSDGDALIVVLAAWCAPCRKELPKLVQLYNRYSSEGLNVIGMSVDYGGIEAIQPIVDRYGVPFPVYWLGEEGIAHYDISAIPLLMVVEGGEIADRITGLQTEKQLKALMKRLVD